jgi:hypothetical protein
MLGVPAAHTLALCAAARRAGHRSRLDQLATVFVAVAAAGGDVPDSAVAHGSPVDQRDRLAHLRAEIRRWCGPACDWAAQTRPERRRGVQQSWAEAQARDYAHEKWPGEGWRARQQRDRWLRSVGVRAPTRRKCGGGAP